MKNLFHHMHMPISRETTLKLPHLLKDQRFWTVVLATLVAAFIVFIIWAAKTSNPQQMPDPFSPLGF